MKSWIAVLNLNLLVASPIAAQGMPPGYVNEMPTPARVLASFAGLDSLDRTARQRAAFTVLRRMIEYEGSGGRAFRGKLTADEQRVYESYAAASALVPTPHFDEAESRRLGWASPSGEWTKLQQHLALDPAFRNELLDRLFSPAWKSSFLAVQARQNHEAQVVRGQAQLKARGPPITAPATSSTLWPELRRFLRPWQPLLQGFVLFSVGLWVVILIAVLRNQSGPRLNAGSKEALRLPDSLRRVKLFRREYDVSCQSGKLYDKELWTETNVTTTTSGGSTYRSGETVHSTPTTTATHVSSTVYHRYWLRSADGREFWRRFPGDVFPATTGQVITTIESGGAVLMAYNHSTDQFSTQRSWYSPLHKLPKGPFWGCWIIPGGYLVWASLHQSTFQTIWAWSLAGIAWVFAVGIVLIPSAILSAIITTTRNRRFEKRVVPAFRQFLKGSTPALLGQFRALPT